MAQAAEVALVSMPFAIPLWPSLGLSLLKAHLREAGIQSDVVYLNNDFAARVDFVQYLDVANGVPSTSALLGEWIFADALRGSDPARDERYVQQVLHDWASRLPPKPQQRAGRCSGKTPARCRRPLPRGDA